MLQKKKTFEFFLLLILYLFLSRIWKHYKRQTNRDVKTLKMPNGPGNLRNIDIDIGRQKKMLYKLGI